MLRRIAWWTGALGLLVLIGWGMVKLSGSTPLPTDGGTLTVPVNATDHAQGPSDAPVTLVEYSDFQCPACRAFQSVLDQVMQEPELKGKIQIIYRNFPLSQHVHSRLAASFAEAAALQGKFWEFHDALFEQQLQWSELSDTAARQAFLGYARTLGLDTDRLTRDAATSAITNRIQADYDGGIQAGVDATPTFFVNGARLAPPASYQEFKNVLLAHATP